MKVVCIEDLSKSDRGALLTALPLVPLLYRNSPYEDAFNQFVVGGAMRKLEKRDNLFTFDEIRVMYLSILSANDILLGTIDTSAVKAFLSKLAQYKNVYEQLEEIFYDLYELNVVPNS